MENTNEPLAFEEIVKQEPVFNRGFRWNLSPVGRPEIGQWCIKATGNYHEKRFSAEFIDDVKGQVFDWINSLGNNNKFKVILTQYDQYGRATNETELIDCTLQSHTVFYRYDNSDALHNIVCFVFEKVERRNELHIQ